MAGKVGCGLLLAVLFCAATVSRAPFVVFLLALAVVFTAFLWWDARTLRRQVTAALHRQERFMTATARLLHRRLTVKEFITKARA